MCGVTKGFSQQMWPWGKFLCFKGVLPRYWSLHASPLGSVLSRLLYCTVKQWTPTHSSAALGSSDENADSLRMQSYSFQRQVWVPVCRCCPSSLTGLEFTRWARLAGSDSEATFPALGFSVSLCGSWGLPRVLVLAWPAIAPVPPPLLNCIECHYASQAGLEYLCSQADLDQQWSSCISFQVLRLQVHTPPTHLEFTAFRRSFWHCVLSESEFWGS